MIRVKTSGVDFNLTVKEYTNGESYCTYRSLDNIGMCDDVEIIWSFVDDNELYCVQELVKTLKHKLKGTGEITLTIKDMPYMTDLSSVKYDSPIRGVKFETLIRAINAMDIDSVRVVDPRNLISVLGLERQRFYNMKTLVADCESCIGEAYDYICYMSQQKMLKYENLGVRDKKVMCYVASRSIKGTIVSDDGRKKMQGARVLIIDDACYKGTTYGHIVCLLKKQGVDSVDLYVTGLSKESYDKDGLIVTDIRNVITMTGSANEVLLDIKDTMGVKTIPVHTVKVKTIFDDKL